VLLLLAGIVAAVPLAAQSRSSAQSQADAYLLQAEAAVGAGRAESAASLIEAALSLAPGYSEALFQRARLHAADQSRGRQVRDDLRAAVAAAGWRRTDADAAARALADVLVRTRALGEAEPILRRLVRERPEDADALALLGRLSARKAESGTAEARRAALSQAQSVFSDGASRFPRDDRFPLGLSRALAAAGQAAAARAAVAAALRELPGSLPLLLRAAELETRPERRVRAVDDYHAAAGRDPLAPLLALEAGAKDSARFLSLFVEHGGLAFVDLTDRAWRKASGSKPLASALRKELAAFTGSRSLDVDRDGFWEERWSIEAGNPLSWERDLDQDGVAELTAHLEAGQPVALDIESADAGRTTFRYSRYPSLLSMMETSGGVVRAAFLAPYSLGLAFLEKGSLPAAAPGLVPRPLRTVLAPPRAQLASAAWRTEETRPVGGALVRRIDRARGLPTYMEEDLDGDGRIDHKIWYEKGTPVRGARDFADDGIFESSEAWKDGRLWKSEVDTDGDGAADFTELAGPEPVRLWDYDADGRHDARQVLRADGSVVREFATARGGIFDLRVVFAAGRIVSVERGGKAVPVRADARRGIVWIGAPAAGAAVSASAPEGFQSAGGRRYLLFRHEGTTYVEELQ
jgi:hypothetical protein